MGKRHLLRCSPLLPQILFNCKFPPSDGKQDQVGFLHTSRSSSEKCLAKVKSNIEMTRKIRTRKKVKMNIFSLEKGKEHDMMMKQSSSRTEKALLEKGSLAVLPSGQGQTKGLARA